MTATRSLAKIALFQQLDAESLRRLSLRCFWRDVGAKEWIIEYSNEGTEIFFVTSGEVRAMIQSVAGRDVILTDIQAGGWFGEISALDGQPRSASIRALTNATIARMSAAVFWEILHQHPSVSDQILKQMAARVRTLTERINEFSSLDVRHRIYAELLRLSRPDPANKIGAIISPPPSHSEIAARISTRREMVTRELKVLERAGLLTRRRGAYVISNKHDLIQRLEDAHEAD
jgi:CRP/FNR family transcriptional regulator, cyclic AMP receptor protein